MRRIVVGFLSIVAILFVIIIVVAITTGGNGNGQTANPATAPTFTPIPPVPTPTPVPLEVTAEEIYQDYDSNEVAAKAKYEGRMALITGSISSVTEAGGGYDVKLATDTSFSIMDIVCKVNKSEIASVITLSEGQEVTILGKIKGKGIFDVEVTDCTVRES